MTCPDDNTLVSYGAGTLSEGELRALELHVEDCESCQALVSEAVRRDPVASPEPSLGPSGDAEGGLGGRVVSGTRLGRYVVLEQAGAGGMGAVFSAFDPKLERKVALKLLHPAEEGDEDPAELQERLLREAQAMARLSHPNVVAVHDVGTWDGRVWVAMEFVEGPTLRRWMGEPERTPTQRLRALQDAGRGLAAAHAAGLVHRDFKPDNVLVGKDGRVCVSDFGLARAQAHGEERSAREVLAALKAQGTAKEDGVTLASTRTGMLVGTPAYMAPEQVAGGKADARSDQFSFCVVAWESFAGARPFDLEALRRMAVARLEAGEAQSGRTSGRSKSGRGPLGVALPAPPSRMPPWVYRCLVRGLSPDPEARFPSMEELLRSLGDDPRVRRRQRALAALATGLLLAGGTALWRQERAAAEARCSGGQALVESAWGSAPPTSLTSAFVATGAPSAAVLAEYTEKALDAYASGWVAMHRDACEATRVRGEQTEQELSLRMACLERRRKELGSLVQLMLAPDKKLVSQAVEAALSLPRLSQCADLAALREPVPLPDSPQARAQLSAITDQLAQVATLRIAGRFVPALEKAKALREQVRPLAHRPTEAEALFHLGWLLDRTGATKEGRGTLEEAVQAAEAGKADLLKARAALKLGWLATNDPERFEQARTWLGLAAASIERVGGNRELEGELETNRGSLLLAEGHPEESLAAYQRGLRLYQLELGPRHAKAAVALGNAANALVELDRPAEALAPLRESITILESVYGPVHPLLVAPLTSEAMAETEIRDFADALTHARRAHQVAVAAFGARHVRVASQLDFVGTVLQAEGRFAESLEAYSQALALKRELLSADDEDLSYSLDGVGQSLLGLGRAREALGSLEEALGLRGPAPLERGETELALARAVEQAQRDRKRSLALARQAEAHFREAKKPKREAEAHALRAQLGDAD